MPHPNPNRFVTFTHPHVETTPETVLQTAGGPITFPERKDHYTIGQTVCFGSVRAAKDFCWGINASAGETVCRVGMASD